MGRQRSEIHPLPAPCPSAFIFLSFPPHSLNPPNRHSRWPSWSKFITATSADNQTLSLDSHRPSLGPQRAGRGVGEVARSGLRGGRAADRWPLSPPPPASFHYSTLLPPIHPSQSSPSLLIWNCPPPAPSFLPPSPPLPVWAGPCRGPCL